MVDDEIQSSHVEFMRIVAIEPNVQVGDLGYKYPVNRWSFWQVGPPLI